MTDGAGQRRVRQEASGGELVEASAFEAAPFHRLLFEHAGIGILIGEVDSRRFLEANPAIAAMLGYTRAELLQLRVDDIHPPGDLARVVAAFEAQARGERLVAEALPCLRKDGTVFHADITTTAALFGGVRCNIGFFTDVSARIAAEEARRASDARYRELLDLLPVTVYECDLSGAVTFVSRACEEAFGFGQADFDAGLTVLDMLLDEDRPKARQAFQSTAASRNIGSSGYRIRDKWGSVRHVLISRAPIVRGGEVVGQRGIVVDETDRVQSAERLHEEHEQLLSIFDNLEEAIYVCDPATYEVLYANAVLRRQLGDVVGKPCFEVFQRRDSPCPHCTNDRIFGDNLGRTHLWEFRNPIAERSYHCIDRAIRWPDGRMVRCEIAIDVEDLRKMESQRERLERLEALGVLAGGIAHDFNNMLVAILGNISLAATVSDPGSKVQAFLHEAETASLRARDLTQRLLTFARGGAPLVRAASLVALLRETAQFTLSGSNVAFEVKASDHPWPAQIDSGQISQVVNNLLLNALQAMPAGGRIDIACDNAVVGHDEVPGLGAGRFLRVTIRDTGMGIASGDLERVFDPYFTTKDGGSGLGLAAVHSIVSKHHGYVALESTAGEGTTVTFYLPAADEDAAAARTEPVTPTGGGGKVLFMDDDRAVRETSARLLGALGYEVIVAHHGAEALDAIVAANAAGAPFAVAVFDLTVRGGEGGVEVMPRLRQIAPDLPVLAASGYSNSPVMADHEAYGFAGVIHKPYNLKSLAAALARARRGRHR